MIARLLARVGLVTPEQRAWAWYDCGNSAYFTTVITAVFPYFFASYAAKGLTPAEATTRFGVITTLAMAIVAVTAPVLGAYGDHTARRKQLLVVFAAVGMLATFLLATIVEGGWPWAALVFVIGNIGVSGSLVFYDSLLPSVAAPEDTDRVSSAGYALGYLGGGVLLLLNLAWILSPATFGLPDAVAATKLSFASVGIWWLLFTVPLLRTVAEPPRLAGVDERASSAIAGTFARLSHTFREIRQYRQAFLALVAMLVYQDGIQTIIRFAGIYGAEVGVGQSEQIAAFAMVQLVGVPFSFLFGSLGARMGTKRAIFLALGVYALAAALGYFMRNATDFFILAAMVGTVQGGAQALSRSLFARLIPPSKTSEYFGFYAVVERFATVLGPLLFTLSGALTGSTRSAVLGMIVFFVAGGWLLSRVDVAEGEAAARAVTP
ncbi:MAG: MFS transporter [Vicinamibacterales bacterium]